MVLPGGGGGVGPSSNIDERDLVPKEWVEDINMEIGHEDDDPFSVGALFGDTYNENNESAQIAIPSQMGTEDQDLSEKKRKRNKGVKRWKPEWADIHKWAYVDDIEGTKKMFCSVCKEYGEETKKNPFRSEGSTNMQRSALVDHGNSFQHKKALLHLQSASNGSNMSCTPEAVEVLRNGNAIIAPVIAAGTGGIMAGEPDSRNLHPPEIQLELQEAMRERYQNIVETADDFGYLNQSPEGMVHGETIAAFLDIANVIEKPLYVEGSNMSCTPEAVEVLKNDNVIIAPAIAAGTGGIVAGELESRNLPSPEIQLDLQEAMREMYQDIVKTADDFGYLNQSPEAMVHGETIAAFLDIANVIEKPLYVEGSNMSCTPEAVEVLKNDNVSIAPAIAAGTGEIVAGEPELHNLPPPEIQLEVQEAMRETYQDIVKTANDFGYLNQSPEGMVHGETIAAFLDIANAMSAQEYL